MKLLSLLLSVDPTVTPIASLAAWWEHHQRIVARVGTTIDHAILGGFAADRLGYAFASGYQAALRRLAPELPSDRLVSLCVTERGGGHPRAIEARLTPTPDGDAFLLRGSKRWATLSDVPGVLLVAAVLGPPDEQGRPQIHVARVDADAPGVTITPLPPTPFTPDILHGELRLDDVRVPAASLLPGDGYVHYLKPFRTIEDLHMQGATFGYLLAEARRIAAPHPLIESMAAHIATLRALSASEASDAGTHVALAGALRSTSALIADLEAVWSRSGSPSYALWERDRPLLGIAESARQKRLAGAWERLASYEPEPTS